MTWRRGIVAVAVGLSAFLLGMYVFGNAGNTVRRYLLPSIYASHVLAVATALSLVGASLAMVSAMRWTRDHYRERETHCRKCNYILRGISEPRCAECGERI